MIVRVEGLALHVRGVVGAPPVLVIGPAPGFPIMQEVPRIERSLGLDTFHAAYLEQRGCGLSRGGGDAVPSIARSIEDVAASARWLANSAGAPVVVIGISLGASYAIAAAARDPSPFRAVVGLGADVDLLGGDAAAHAFLVAEATARGHRRALDAAATIVPPVTTARAFQVRAKWLTELGGMQPGARWGPTVRRTFVDIVRSYGPFGAVGALRAMTRVQDAMLPELAMWSLHDVRSIDVPLALVHGVRDAISPPELVGRWLEALAAPHKSLRLVEGIGHLPHIEAPEIVREVLAGAV